MFHKKLISYLCNKICKMNDRFSIKSEQEFKEFLKSMRSAIYMSDLALHYWDTIAEFVESNKGAKESAQSFLDRHLDIYYITMVTQLYKIYDPHKDVLSYRSAKKYLSQNGKSLKELKSITKELEPHIIRLIEARNKYIAHTDKVKTMTRNDPATMISISNIEEIIKGSKDLFNCLYKIIDESGGFDPEKYREVNFFKHLLRQSKEKFFNN